ncbi:NADP-dependent oxidoreductase [Streptomyces sp. NPDC004111]|uniref:NADP-dependent oxidoreductase n=1 Tax=Streptomyces sp. NPDC004111 TaxID=3364690 RepID=UPI00368CACCC
MRAIVVEEFGGIEVLKEVTVPDVHAGPGQVRLRVAAIGVNPVDSKLRAGLMQQVMPVELPFVPGLDVAGVVDEVGAGVTGFAVGDEVFGWASSGAYAEYAVASEVVRKPAGLSWEQAVALPVAGETAHRVLTELGVTEGETLLVNGAAGAVGSFAVQLAVARGVRVVGTASAANHAHLRELGALAVTYGEGLVRRVREVAPQGVDAVFDVAGRGALPDSIALRGGTTDRIVTVGDFVAAAEHKVAFSARSSTDPLPVFAEHARLVAGGTLRVRVAEVLPLARAAKAHEISDGGHAKGKLVLVP